MHGQCELHMLSVENWTCISVVVDIVSVIVKVALRLITNPFANNATGYSHNITVQYFTLYHIVSTGNREETTTEGTMDDSVTDSLMGNNITNIYYIIGGGVGGGLLGLLILCGLLLFIVLSMLIIKSRKSAEILSQLIDSRSSYKCMGNVGGSILPHGILLSVAQLAR